MLPDLRRDVANYVIRQVVSFGPQGLDGTGQVNGVPQDDGADHEVETGSTESLALEGAIADFAALVEEDCPGQLVAGLALVQPGPTAAAQWLARIPLGHEQGPLNPTYLTQRERQRPDAVAPRGLRFVELLVGGAESLSASLAQMLLDHVTHDWALRAARLIGRTNFPADNSSVSASPGRWRSSHRLSSPTSR